MSSVESARDQDKKLWDAINHTTAVIEFSPDGIIRDVKGRTHYQERPRYIIPGLL
ncbi:MAG: hypothetical protein ACYCRD_05775 [Leptospirillum sp.]